MDPVPTGIVNPIQGNVNQTLSILRNPLIGLIGLPSNLSIDVNGLLTQAASGSDIGLNVIAKDGTIVGPNGTCNASATSFMLDTPAGLAIGGNMITGLGAAGQQASAGEINSIAFGNRAVTNAAALRSIAIGPDAAVGAGGTGSVAIGSLSAVSVANSVALGAGSIAARGPLTGYTAPLLTGTFNSVGEISVGAPGALRQITNIAPGTAATDAVNLQQLQAVAAAIPQNAVTYTDATQATVALGGAAGTTITNVAPGAVTATSTDAVNGAQLYATNQQVAANTTAIANLSGQVTTNTTAIANLSGAVTSNTTAITNLSGQVTANTTAITNLQTAVSVLTVTGGSPVQYSDPGSPTVPNGGMPTNDVTIVGATAGPVTVHNVAAGSVSTTSTDAVNGAQLNATNTQVAQAQTTATTALGLAQNSVQYDNAQRSSVTLNSGGGATRLGNVANGVAANDAVNLSQLQSALGNSLTNAVSLANAYTDSRFGALQFDLRDARRQARAGTAAALAAGAIPQPNEAGRTMIGAGVGTYAGRSAFAFGAAHATEDGKALFRVGITYDSSSKVGANAGAGFQF
ncbi:hypothetical protein GCM10022281_03690 [Sphingomonas rosea]|uniref:Uncharacterized protein n=2 Tax=Sphingomonas rosea TaxID=335605 RepID=A0ABP7TM22_9SPHN